MRFLLDTHVWLWLVQSPGKIATPVRQTLETAEELVLSVASVWEMAIKVQLGKLTLRRGPESVREEILNETGARELVIGSEHAFAAAALPRLHRDPFDRMLIGQSVAEGLVLVTADEAIRQYGTAIQWAI